MSLLFGINIIYAKKQRKGRKRSKLDLKYIDFDNFEIYIVNYMPTSFERDVTFVLLMLPNGVPHAYGQGMDDMNNIYDGHACARQKQPNIQKNNNPFWMPKWVL